MIDAGVVGAKLPEGQTRHWLVNGVKVSSELYLLLHPFLALNHVRGHERFHRLQYIRRWRY